MAISYPVNVEDTLWAVYDSNLGSIIHRNRRWPRSDGEEISGLSPDFIYLLQIEDTPPPFDSNLIQLQRNEIVDIAENEVRYTWSSVQLPSEEQKIAADGRFLREFENHFPFDKVIYELVICVGLLAYSNNYNQPLPDKWNEYLKNFTRRVRNAILANRNRREAIYQEIDNPEVTANFDDGWSPPSDPDQIDSTKNNGSV